MTTSIQKKLRIGSRKSQLALFQSNYVMNLLKNKHPEIKYEIVSMFTTGDNILDVPLSQIGEKGLFTKELEIALERNIVNVVVHSLKDLPTTLPAGMIIGAICKREKPYDAVVFSRKVSAIDLESLPKHSIIGTSSLRRIAQLKRLYPHLKFESIRGNLNTRLKKLDEGDHYSALILAVAGLERMDLGDRISIILPPHICMYAVGQGALAVECKAEDLATLQLLDDITDVKTTLCCTAERAFMRALEGGCSVPVAVSSSLQNQKLLLKGGVFSLDGSKSIVDSVECDIPEHEPYFENELKAFCGIVSCSIPHKCLSTAEKAGTNLSEIFLAKGAREILDEIREHKNVVAQ